MVPQKSIDAALAWLTGAARVADNQPVGERGKAMPLQSWQGAIRGEYLSTRKNWDSFCPVCQRAIARIIEFYTDCQ